MWKFFTISALTVLFCINLNAAKPSGQMFTNNIFIEKLDSVHSVMDGLIFDKEEYKYDEYGRLIEEVRYDYENDELRPYIKKTHEYDETGNLLSYVLYFWNNISKEWGVEDKYDYEYDENNNLIRNIYTYIINDNMHKFKYEYTYNEKNLLVNETTFRYKDSTYTYSSKVEYNYNDNDNLNEEITSTYKNDTWEYTYKYTFEYDENDNLLFEKHFNFYEDTYILQNIDAYKYDDQNNQIEYKYGSFDNDSINYKSKITYNYDDNHNMIEQISYYNSDGIFFPMSKDEYQYENDRMTNWISSRWSDSAQTWQFRDRRQTVRDENGNTLEDIYYEYYNEENSKWIPEQKQIFEYDLTKEMTEIMFPDIDEGSDRFFNKITYAAGMRYNYPTKEYIMQYDGVLYYSPVTTSVQKTEELRLSIYPNPVSNSIFIKGLQNVANLEIYSLNGRKVLSQKVHQGISVDVSNLRTGVFYYKINVGNKNITGKFIKN